MTRVYLDSSAILKRVLVEDESAALADALDQLADTSEVLISSSLAWLEVSRALRRATGRGALEIADDVDAAFAGVAEMPVSSEVLSLARRVGPSELRSLDAVHLASALITGAEQVLTYDERLSIACRHNGLAAVGPVQL